MRVGSTTSSRPTSAGAGFFRDVIDIAPGEDFVAAMDRALGACDVFLPVIGRQWLTVAARGGGRRLDEPGDHVRDEVAAALARPIRVIPILVARAEMPAEGDLPPELRALARRNAMELRDTSWDQDVARLIQAIETGRAVSPARHRSPSPGTAVRLALAVLGLAIVLGGGWLFFWPTTPPAPSPSAVPPNAAVPTNAPSAVPPNAPSAVPPNAPLAVPTATPLAVPPGARAILFRGGGHVIYEVIGGRLEPASGGHRRLNLTVRMSNYYQYPQNFWDSSFRLLVDGTLRAPESGLNEIVGGKAAAEGTVTFDLPAGTHATALRVTNGHRTSDIPLGDLAPGASRDAPPPPAPYTRAIDTDVAFGPESYRIGTATFEAFSDTVVLRIAVRMINRKPYQANFLNSSFRLIVNGVPREPAGTLNELVDPQSALDAVIIFDLPAPAPPGLVLKVGSGSRTADVRLD